MSNYDPKRAEIRYFFTDTGQRDREEADALQREINKHVAAFLKKGGKIKTIPAGQTAYNEFKFSIKTEAQKVKTKQKWKEDAL